MIQQRIAVVGAGMAGMACAQRLVEHGKHVEVFEKSRGLGGRMSTRRGEAWQCDHGAQYFTASNDAFEQQVRRWVDDGIVAPWRAHIAAFDETGWRQLADSTIRYVGLPGMNAPVAALVGSIMVHRGTQIVALQRRGESWQLVCQDDGAFPSEFDSVVLAMPAPQAYALVSAWSAELAIAAQSVEMLPSWALMAQFAERPFADFDAAFINQGPLRWMARQASKPGRPPSETWLIHANAIWSTVHLDAPADEVSQAIAAEFKLLGGIDPVEHTLHRWRYADIDCPLMQGSAFDASRRIGLCGDWLNGGKVEGAWLSGRHLADKLLQLD